MVSQTANVLPSRNWAISHVSDDVFKSGHIYACSETYQGMVDVAPTDDSGLVTMDVGDPDFTFIFNVQEKDVDWIKSRYSLAEYEQSEIS